MFTLRKQLVTLWMLGASVSLWPLSVRAVAQSETESDLQRHSEAAGQAMARHDYAAAESEYLAVVRLAPGMAEARSNLGLACYLQKKYDPATKQFKRALELNPSLYAPNYFLGRIRHSQRRFGDAVPLLERAAALQPRNCEIRRQLGASLVALKEFHRAIEHYQLCLKEDPRDIETLYDLGVVYMNLARQAFDRVAGLPESPFSSLIKADHYASFADWDQAEHSHLRQASRVEYRRALEVDPNLLEIRVRLGELELGDRSWEAAGRLFKEELAKDASSYLSYFGLARVSFEQMDLPSTLKYLNEAAGIRPEFFESLPNFSTSLPREKLTAARLEIQGKVEACDFGRAFLLVAIAAQLGDSSQENVAPGALRKALDEIKSRLGSAGPANETDPKQLKEVGLQLLRQKRYEAGTQVLLPLAQKADADPVVQLVVAKALISMKRYGEAAPLLELYASKHRDAPEVDYWQGVCYQRAAMENLQAMIAIDPQSYRLHWFMGDAYFEKERYEEATKEYRAALDRAPGNSYLYLNLGNVCYRQMKYVEATEYYRRALDSDVQNGQAHLMLGDSLLLQRNAEQAIPHLRTALQLDPSLLQTHEKLSKALAMLNQFEEAVRELELAAELDKDGSLHYQLGTYYRKLGREDKVAAAFAKSQELRERKLKAQQVQTIDDRPSKREP
jgi:tetratricopeptide (TPR) repeat protein